MIISEMHHRITYVYINFQQIRVNIVSQNYAHNYNFAYNRKLHKFATTNSNF